MYSFFLVLLLLLVRTHCEDDQHQWLEDEVENKFMVSVKEYPSLLHKCTATFIRPDILLTTAKCLYCEGECKFFVYAFSNHLMSFGNGMLINIEKTITHPHYERNPHRNDVGLIKLNNSLTDAMVLSLPTQIYEKSGIAVTSYSWQFADNLMDYSLKRQKESTISQALCSLAFNRYIDYKRICSRRSSPIKRGPFDDGSPLITEENQKKIILGFYTSESLAHNSKLDIYQSLIPFTDWIRKMLLCDFNCSAPSSDNNTNPPDERISTSTTLDSFLQSSTNSTKLDSFVQPSTTFNPSLSKENYATSFSDDNADSPPIN